MRENRADLKNTMIIKGAERGRVTEMCIVHIGFFCITEYKNLLLTYIIYY